MITGSIRTLFFLLLSYAGLAQLPQYALNRIQEEGGLKTADVLNMARDSRGFLWISTHACVYAFDGRHTHRYTFDATVTHVHIDACQRKWVNTRNGLYLFDEAVRQFKKVVFEGEEKSSAAQWYEKEPGKVNAFLKGKHFVFDESTQTFTNQALAPSDISISRYFGKYNQWQFYGNSDAIIRFSESGSHQLLAFHNPISAFPINKDELIVSDNRYSTYKVNFKDITIRLLSTPDLPLFGEKLVCYSSIPIGDTSCLFASNKGLFLYQNSTGSISFPELYYRGRPFENQSSVSSLFTDDEGTVYMNSSDGIFMLNPVSGFIQHIRNYSYRKESLPGNDVRNFTEDKYGNIWIATTSGIARLDPVTGRLQSFNPLNGRGLVDFPSYRQLLADENYLWIGTSGNGVWYYNMENGKCLRPELIKDTTVLASDFEKAYIWSLVKLRNGKLLAVSGTHLYVINMQSKQASIVDYSFSEKVSRAAIQDQAGRVWHGTTEGLTCIDSTYRELFQIRDSFPDKRVAAFCEWKSDHILIGSRGLFEVKLEGNKIESFSQKNAIPEEQFIYCMKQDRNGFVWLGTDDGIFRYDPVKDEAHRFDISDGVQSQAFNSDGAFFSSKGVMYLGGRNGFNYFKPEEFKLKKASLKPFVLSFSVTIGDSMFAQLPQEIPYNVRNIDFVISAPELNKPFQVQYRYRLNNTDDSWTYLGFNNHVRITNLKPGNYNLQVSAGYDNKTWFDSKEIIPITVLRPWWQTEWFIFICVIISSLSLWIGFIYYYRKEEENKIKRMMEYFSHSGSANGSIDIILWDISRNCISHLGFEDCIIYLLDENRGVLVQKAAYGAKNPGPFIITNPIEIPLGKGITGHVAVSGIAELIPDTQKDSRYVVDDINRRSELTVPIFHNDRVIGVIDSEHRKKNFFKVHHLKALQTVATLCATKIETAKALEAVRKAEDDLKLLDVKMTEAKFLNLRLQMNPHFLFNILTTIQYLIISKQVNKATNYLDIFSGFLRALLDHAEDTVVSLEEDLRILKLYVELESLCLDESFEWTINVDDEIDQEEMMIPFMLLQPFVENAIHHGLIHKIGVKKFSIQVDKIGDSLRCIVEDNGIGRGEASLINNRSLSKAVHKSKGISIVEKRLELLQQKTGKKAQLHFEDIMENGISGGTRVHITLPDYNNIGV